MNTFASNVLIIDDEVDACFLLVNMLKQKKLNASFAHSLNEGIAKVNVVKPTLLFLDINLPDGSGLESISRIKQIHPPVKVIMISAFDGIRERSVARELGANMFISKPLTKDVIMKAVETLHA